MTPDHQQALRDAIAEFDTSETRARYQRGDFPRAAAVKDLDKRYRWDLFWAANRTPAVRAAIHGGDYQDVHIDTALRSIVPTLGGA